MPKARLRYEVLGRGVAGRSEPSDCIDKQHGGSTLAAAKPKDKRVVHQKRDLTRNLRKPAGGDAGMDLFVRPHRRPAAGVNTSPIKKASNPFEPEAISLDTSYFSIRPLLCPPPVLPHP